MINPRNNSGIFFELLYNSVIPEKFKVETGLTDHDTVEI